MKTNLREVTSAPLLDPKRPTGFKAQYWGYVFALLGTVFFSMKSIFIKLVYQPVDGLSENGVEAITIMAMRLGFSAPFNLAKFLSALKRRKEADLPDVKKRDLSLASLTGMLG